MYSCETHSTTCLTELRERRIYEVFPSTAASPKKPLATLTINTWAGKYMIYNYIGKTLAIYLLSRQGLSGIHTMWLEAFDLQSWIWLWDPTVLIREAVLNLLNRSCDTPVSVVMSSLPQGHRSCLMSSHCEEKFCTTPLTDVQEESRWFISFFFPSPFNGKRDLSLLLCLRFVSKCYVVKGIFWVQYSAT